MLSFRDGKTLNTKLVRKFMTRRQLIKSRSGKKGKQHIRAADDASPTSLTMKELEILLIFLDGHVENGLKVKPSGIQGAGLGLFATRNFRKDELLCVYRGREVSFTQLLNMDMKDKDYVMGGFGMNCHIDAAKHPEVLARYINDKYQVSGASNVHFVKLKRYKVALVVALRDIECNEELYASYGSGYWKSRKK
eukprot:g4107.t1